MQLPGGTSDDELLAYSRGLLKRVAPPNPPRQVAGDPIKDFFQQDLEKHGAPVQYDSSYSVKIDFARLGLQWLLVCILAFGYVSLGRRVSNRPEVAL
jgi:hypothetical protein